MPLSPPAKFSSLISITGNARDLFAFATANSTPFKFLSEMDGGGDVAMTPAGLDWKFSVDVISAIEFDKAGDHLATGDRGGRVMNALTHTTIAIPPSNLLLSPMPLSPPAKFSSLISITGNARDLFAFATANSTPFKFRNASYTSESPRNSNPPPKSVVQALNHRTT
ncbi:hypothetical protein LXL04_015806 [Taraxacum kok-saghyz]